MRKTILTASLLLLTLSFGISAFAQDAPATPQVAKEAAAPAHYYHLTFLIQEVGQDNKPVNGRVFTTTVTTAPHMHASLRTGSSIPVLVSPFISGEGKPMGNQQYQRYDVGVNIDVNAVHEIDRQLVLELSADVSGMAADSDPGLRQPVVRQNKWQSVALIPVGKQTVVFSSDSLDSKGNLQLLVTATLMQ